MDVGDRARLVYPFEGTMMGVPYRYEEVIIVGKRRPIGGYTTFEVESEDGKFSMTGGDFSISSLKVERG